MDYKYITLLLERYGRCETSVEEEAILRAFFSQRTLPAELERQRALFAWQAEAAEVTPPAGFEQRLLERVGQGEESSAARRDAATAPRRQRASLRPLMRAAAAVAVVMVLGGVAQRAFSPQADDPVWDYNAAAYTDTYDSPQQAAETLEGSFQQFKAALAASQGDSTAVQTPAGE